MKIRRSNRRENLSSCTTNREFLKAKETTRDAKGRILKLQNNQGWGGLISKMTRKFLNFLSITRKFKQITQSEFFSTFTRENSKKYLEKLFWNFLPEKFLHFLHLSPKKKVFKTSKWTKLKVFLFFSFNFRNLKAEKSEAEARGCDNEPKSHHHNELTTNATTSVYQLSWRCNFAQYESSNAALRTTTATASQSSRQRWEHQQPE